MTLRVLLSSAASLLISRVERPLAGLGSPARDKPLSTLTATVQPGRGTASVLSATAGAKATLSATARSARCLLASQDGPVQTEPPVHVEPPDQHRMRWPA